MNDGSKTITVYTSKDFRKWLKTNHNKEQKVAVILHKRHTDQPAPTHRELINEAICYGWIDTTVKRLDDDRFVRNFSRRNQNSKWSENTLSYARQLIKEKRMTPNGLKYYKLGLKKPTHDRDIPKNPRMPKALNQALANDKTAQKNFAAFPPSTKKMMYRWLLSAKLPQTKQKRINRIVDLAKANQKKIF